MLKYSFMSKYSNCSKEDIIKLIEETDKGFVYTYGFEYRNPTTHRVPITKEKALEYVKDTVVNITEEDNQIHINRYSDNDLW